MLGGAGVRPSITAVRPKAGYCPSWNFTCLHAPTIARRAFRRTPISTGLWQIYSNRLERQSAKMAMNGAVAAKDERRIGPVGGIEFASEPQSRGPP
jgi:hypothetical protein